jgi:hypothetical protein
MFSERYLRDESGAVGTQTLDKWSGFSGSSTTPAPSSGRTASR